MTYPLNQWIHVKVVFWEDQAQIFIDDMTEPALRVPDLKHETRSGGIGLGTSAPAYFSEFSYRAIETPPFEQMPRAKSDTPEGMIGNWQVSSPFEESRLASVNRLDQGLFADLDWQPLQSEATGITNLARLHGMEKEKNTVVARVRIRSDREQIKPLRLGYSDKVRVYVNGRPLYSGDNTYRSRDYRYLGTIGLFDEIYLPLQEGENDVWFAVTEAFGGWGIMAAIEDRTSIRIETSE